MITKLTLRNFKSVGKQVYEFTSFDLLVGFNNSGKSTVLQALAIWQFCIDQFHTSRRTGKTGIQVVLPNFTALPLPEFILLWKDRTDRTYPLDENSGERKQQFILIEIIVEWRDAAGEKAEFGVELRYHSPQTIYAIPAGGWARFRECETQSSLPKIAYVPPFSGLEPMERRLDLPPIRQQVGKGQPGSVLRNLLLLVNKPPKDSVPRGDWEELAATVKRWFSVDIGPPKYDENKDVHIKVEYEQQGRAYDVIAGGSGFHQTLTLLAFLYGYRPTTILLDEPDAHLHVNLQREILDFFKGKSRDLGTQFLIATHAEEFARGVDASQIMSLLSRVPRRVDSKPSVLRAMADVSNEEIARLMPSPYILYVEGESDERILRGWADRCDPMRAIDKVCFKAMEGGGKKNMKERADQHFAALQEIIPSVRRLMLFDFDNVRDAFHPKADNPALAEWKRKNIENYLLVAAAWRRTVLRRLQLHEDDLFAQQPLQIVDRFFMDQNLTLPPGRDWRTLGANVFSVVDGKRILFEDADSLFQQLRHFDPRLSVIREDIAREMDADEIHDDVHAFFGKLAAVTAAH